MKYLFFDIECSNCFNGKGKVCEFGYVITDENFKIISAQDIPMSPGKGRGNRFHLRDRMAVEDVKLAYDETYYYEQPELPAFYERIKKLMSSNDTICFAFSMSNDIRYLADSCIRYKLPLIDYTCYDVQKLAAEYLELKGQPGLMKCVEEIVGPHATFGLVEHLSRDDAKMEMMIVEAICVLNQIDLKTLLVQSESAKTNSVEFIDEFKKAQEIKNKKNEARRYIQEIAKKHAPLINDEQYKGKRYSVSNKIRVDLDLLKRLISNIERIGGLFTVHYVDTDHLIVLDDDNLKRTREKFADIFFGDYILLDDFIKEDKEE